MEPTRAPWQRSSELLYPETVPKPNHTSNVLSTEGAPWVHEPTTFTAHAPTRPTAPNSVPITIETEPHMPTIATCTYQFAPATKKISCADDLKAFLQGQNIKDFLGFILLLNQAVTGKKLSDQLHVSEPVSRMLSVLDNLSTWVDEIPPEEQSLRYGNPAFRTWFKRLTSEALSLMKSVLPESLQAASIELATYLTDSFGNPTRIDYGTGHETTFCALLYCFAKLGVFTEHDREALVLRVFKKYLDLMRKIQTTYWLEPAGSHGVWGLDDYHFLPFIWGSAQLISHPMIKPKSIHNSEILEMYAEEYLYLGCVQFVKQVKRGMLSETSPIINDISTVPTWTKVNTGMIKMYQAEVLSKFPIMQHFLFGSLIGFE